MIKRTKQLTAIFVILMMTGMSPVTMAQPAPIVPLVTPSSLIQVGVVAAVTGMVHLKTPGQVGRLVESGEKVYRGDIVKTDSKSTIQLMLMDETIFTIGPDSSMTIDEFVYDSSSDAGKISARVIEGAFRFITGRIPQKKPSNMEVKLPVGVMAVRGTIVYLKVKGQESTGILAGPGERHNTQHRIGKFIMMNEVDHGDGRKSIKQTHVTQPGRASRIGGHNTAPTPSFNFPKIEYNQLKEQFVKPLQLPKDKEDKKVPSRKVRASSKSPNLVKDDPRIHDTEGDPRHEDKEENNAPPSHAGPVVYPADPISIDHENPPSDSGSLSVTQLAGQDQYGALGSLSETFHLGDTNDYIDEILEDEATDTIDDDSQILDGISRFRDLLTIETGQYHYSAQGVAIGGGTYDFKMNIDYGARTVGGGGSGIVGSSTNIAGANQNFSFSFGTQQFGFDNADAIFNFTGHDSSCGDSGCDVNANVFLLNEGGDPGNSADHTAEITDINGANILSGSDTSSRLSGNI